MMKTKRLRNPSSTVTRIGAAEPILDEVDPAEQQGTQKLKERVAGLQKIANLLNGKKS
jgi:hypothetical protein